MNLIILSEEDRTGDSTYTLKDARFRHICSVLSSNVGDFVRVGILNGPIGRARVADLSEDRVILECERLADPPNEPLVVDLICAVPRPQTVKKVLATIAAMGVRNLHLVRANRTEKSYLDSPVLQPSGYLPHLLEGLSQSKRTRLPDIKIHPLFRPFAEDELPSLTEGPDKRVLKLLAHGDSEDRLQDVYSRPAEQAILAIGPEGGWVPFEVGLFQKRGFRAFALGPWTLRVETAVAAGLAQLEQARAMLAVRTQ